MNAYEFQVNRIIRGLKKIPRDPFIPYVSDELFDDYYHLFTDIFHLKDWLLNGSDFDKKVVNDYFENDEYLKKLQSLANGMKHLKITGKFNKFPKAQQIYAKWKNEKDCGEAVLVIFSIDDNDAMLGSAFVVACINSLNRFFKENKHKEPFSLDQMR
jgi:hypothetical protein